MFKSIRSALGSKSSTQVAYEFEMRSKFSALERGTPPPVMSSESRFAKINVNQFLDHSGADVELGVFGSGDSSLGRQDKAIRVRLISADTGEMTPEDSHGVWVAAIRGVITASTVQVVSVLFMCLCLGLASPVLNRAVLFGGSVVAGSCAYLIIKFGARLTSSAVLFGFMLYTMGIAFSFRLLATLVSEELVSHLLVQVAVATLGLLYYSWTTSFGDWGHIEERIFGAVPSILATLVLWLVLGHEILPLTISLAIGLTWCLVHSECSKDITIPAKSLDQLLSDVVFLHLSTLETIKFLACQKLRRAFEKHGVR